MSVINRALADIAEKNTQETTNIERAEIAPLKNSGKLAWAIGGFAVSLGLGGWAVSQQGTSLPATVESAATELASHSTLPEVQTVPEAGLSLSPTSKVIENSEISLYSEPVKSVQGEKAISAASKPTRKAQPVAKAENVIKAEPANNTEPEPVLIAQVASKNPEVSDSSSLKVEQVRLAPAQLSQNAIERGKKALDSNDLDGAIAEFESALRYVPSDDETRKRLAALYYGKKNLRKSVEVLQQGLRLDETSQELRLALSKMLIKEKQPEAALTPLVYLPEEPGSEYLALRAAIAQQVKNTEVAYETYSILVEKEPDSARWWLGLAIQQERKLQYPEAVTSYKEAISRVGVSKQTQAFIRDRLKLLTSLGENSDAD